MMIFYSWQKDLPNNTNLSFIETALKKAVRTIRGDDSIQIELAIDRDTQGVPGSPEIPKIVLSKIDNCDIFLCDLSIINKGSKFKATPNPNVLFELGYALRKFNNSDSLNWENIIMVMNTAFGEINKLPFDLEKRRVITYSIYENAEDKAAERKVLEGKLESAIRSIIKQMPSEEVIEPPRDKTLSQFEELKQKQNLEEFRSRWLNTSAGLQDFRKHVNSFFNLFQQKYESVKELYSDLELELIEKKGFRIIFHKYVLLITLEQRNNERYPNPISFAITYCLKQRAMSIQNSLFNLIGHSKEVTPNINEQREFVWENARKQNLTSQELCDEVFQLLIDEFKKYNSPQEIPYSESTFFENSFENEETSHEDDYLYEI